VGDIVSVPRFSIGHGYHFYRVFNGLYILGFLQELKFCLWERQMPSWLQGPVAALGD
jgi:hypothetical protein